MEVVVDLHSGLLQQKFQKTNKHVLLFCNKCWNCVSKICIMYTNNIDYLNKQYE